MNRKNIDIRTNCRVWALAIPVKQPPQFIGGISRRPGQLLFGNSLPLGENLSLYCCQLTRVQITLCSFTSHRLHLMH